VSTYRLVVAPTAKKELKRLPEKTTERILKAVEALADNPRPHGSLKLEGTQNQYRIRVGDYRVIYSIADDVLTVLVIRIRHRKDAYR
jgi:mRNA interferase RelE/StbE